YLGAYLLHPRLHLNLHRFQLWICFSLHIFSNYLFSGKFISDNTLAIVAVDREDVGTFYGPAPSLFKISCSTITLFYSNNSIQGNILFLKLLLVSILDRYIRIYLFLLLLQ